MAKAASRDKPIVWRELVVVLTNDHGIQAINEDVLGHSGVTDVITFRYDSLPGESGDADGELVVNVACALADANRQRRAMPTGSTADRASREFALYLAHGCDHLSGETDDDITGRQRMRRRELRWLRAADEAGLIAGLLKPKDDG
ncbi:MAG: rRNA maturation RNase YbeY [Verrucomicrobia bacterium]|nr:rRNA maturation RNase YbeY [Verrucomicrobiota bacterium]